MRGYLDNYFPTNTLISAGPSWDVLSFAHSHSLYSGYSTRPPIFLNLSYSRHHLLMQMRWRKHGRKVKLLFLLHPLIFHWSSKAHGETQKSLVKEKYAGLILMRFFQNYKLLSKVCMDNSFTDRAWRIWNNNPIHHFQEITLPMFLKE